MASDLAGTPQTGIRVQLCGDAHLANFGGFASAERQLLFDLVDFDETLPGPWEWDVKRLAASATVAGRENGFTPKRRTAIARQLVGEYRRAIREFATMPTLDVWYARASVSDVGELLRSRASESQLRRFDKTVSKGRRKDSARAFAKLAVKGHGVGAMLNMETSFTLADAPEGGTAMAWSAEVKILGPVGSMGQRVLQPIVNQQVQHVLGALDVQVQAAVADDAKD